LPGLLPSSSFRPMTRSALEIIDTAEAVRDEPPEDLQATYDKLKLMGAVLAVRTLLDIMLGSANANARLGAAKELSRMDEDPEEIARRIKSSEFASMTIEELEELVRGHKDL